MKRSALCLAALLVLCACALLAAEGITFHDSKFGVTLTFPKGWVKEKAQIKGTLAQFSRPLEGGRKLGVSVVAQLSPEKMDVNIYTDETLQFTKSALDDCTVEKNEPITVAGRKAREVILRYSVLTGKKKIIMKALQLFMMEKGNAYCVTGKATESDFDLHLAELREIVRSVRISAR
jgi:hypothetical protein